MATSICLSKQCDKKANDRHGMWSEKQLRLLSWLSGTENPHRILRVGQGHYRISIVQCCSISPTGTTCRATNRAVCICFHCQTPQAKGHRPLKGEDRSLSNFENKLRNTSRRDNVRQMKGEGFWINSVEKGQSHTADWGFFIKVWPAKPH